MTHGPVHIHIEGDVYGTVAVDTIAKSIENNVKRGLDGQEVADAFTTLAEAFQSDPELDDSVRKEALEYLDVSRRSQPRHRERDDQPLSRQC